MPDTDPPEPTNPDAPKPGEVDEADKPFLLLAYLGPLAGLSLLTRPGSPLVVFHAKQGLTLTAVLLAYLFIEIILVQVPYLGPVVWATGFVVWPVAVGLIPYAIVQAFDDKRWAIPGVSKLASKW